MIRKITETVSNEVLQQDMERYRRMALELGATDAKIITSDMVLIDERVRAKCMYPKCEWYGTNINCPPHAMGLDMARNIVSKFQYGIFIQQLTPPEEVIPAARDKRPPGPSRTQFYELISKIEAEAFYDGYYLAIGFAGGPCKMAFCPNAECSALQPGEGCRHPLRGRSAMEAVGMNAFAMAAKVGWDIYPIGGSISPGDVPHRAKLGLILIY